jgi:hypothetical protein
MENDLNKAIQKRDVAKKLSWYLIGVTVWTFLIASLSEMSRADLNAFAGLLFITSVCYEYEVHWLWYEKVKQVISR